MQFNAKTICLSHNQVVPGSSPGGTTENKPFKQLKGFFYAINPVKHGLLPIYRFTKTDNLSNFLVKKGVLFGDPFKITRDPFSSLKCTLINTKSISYEKRKFLDFVCYQTKQVKQ